MINVKYVYSIYDSASIFTMILCCIFFLLLLLLLFVVVVFYIFCLLLMLCGAVLHWNMKLNTTHARKYLNAIPKTFYMLLYILRKYFKSNLSRHRKAQLNQENTEDRPKPSNETTMANLSADILCKEEKTEELESTQPRESANISSSGNVACPTRSPLRKKQKKEMETGIDSASDESSCPANILKSPDGASAPVSLNLSDHNCYVRIDTKNPKESKVCLLGSGANSDVYAFLIKWQLRCIKKMQNSAKLTLRLVR